MNSFTEIISAWGRDRLALDLGVPKETVRSWERFNTFPDENWKLALELAPARNIAISRKLLIELAAKN